MPAIDDQTNFEALVHVSAKLAKFKAQICASLEYAQGSHTFDDVAALVLTGRLTMWEEGSSFVMTEIVEYPRKRTMHVFLAGGNREDLHSIHPRMIAYARSEGCSDVTLSGRAGWLRVLEHIGWEEVYRVLKLDLSQRLPIEGSEEPMLPLFEEVA